MDISQIITQKEKNEHLQILFLKPDYLVIYPDIKTRQGPNNKDNFRPVSLMNTEVIIPNKILSNQIQEHIEKIIHHDQTDSIPKM